MKLWIVFCIIGVGLLISPYAIGSRFSTFSLTVGTPVTAASIQVACDQTIAAGGGTVYVPAGDWRIDQQATAGYGQPGGAIYIDLETLPSGAWLNIIGLGGNTTVVQQNGQTLTNVPACILRSFTCNNNNLTSSVATFDIVGSKEVVGNANAVKSENKHIRLSGFTILGDVLAEPTLGESPQMSDNNGITMGWVDGFLIDHCAVDGNTGSDISVGASKGVITDCSITAFYHLTQGGIWNYGISVGGNFNYLVSSAYGTPTWIQDVSQIRGKYDWQGITLNYTVPPGGTWSSVWPSYTTSSVSFTAGPVYVEDSMFDLCRHSMTSSGFGYYVVRHCVFNRGMVIMPFIDTHGGGQWSLAAAAYATRGCEIYDNVINGGYAGQYGIGITGGAALIYNNVINNVARGVLLGNRNYNATDPNDPEYVNDAWIWHNTFNQISMSNLEIDASNGITPNVNYFSDAAAAWDNESGPYTPVIPPTTTQPPPLGYESYVYPHPLSTGLPPPTTQTTQSISSATTTVLTTSLLTSTTRTTQTQITSTQTSVMVTTITTSYQSTETQVVTGQGLSPWYFVQGIGLVFLGAGTYSGYVERKSVKPVKRRNKT